MNPPHTVPAALERDRLRIPSVLRTGPATEGGQSKLRNIVKGPGREKGEEKK